MTQISAQDLERRTVGEVVAEDYGRAAVFERYGIDFCCGGDRSVRDACEEAGVVYDELVHALAETGPGQAGESDVRSWPLDELADHIVAVHHHYVRESLPPLVAFSEKVARVHGSGHEELLEIQGLVGELAAELNRHMQAEENLLFPRMAEIVSGEHSNGAPGTASGSLAGPGQSLGGPLQSLGGPLQSLSGPLESLGGPLQSLGGLLESLEDDHELAGALMHRIRELSGGFVAPDDACNTYRAFYAKLAEFETDLHLHVHLENNVLFPGVRALVKA